MKKVKRKFNSLTALLLTFLFLTSCSGEEVNNRAFVQLMGLEKVQGIYNVYIQFFNAQGSSTSPDISKSNSSYASGSGTTIYDALSDAETHTGKSLFLGHIKLIILGNGITSPADDLSVFLDGTISPSCPAVYCSSPESIAQTLTEEGIFSADSILKTMDTYVKNGKCIYTDIASIEESIRCYNAAEPLPIIRSDGEKISFSGAVLAGSNGIYGKIPEDEILGLHFLNTNIKSDDNIVISIHHNEKNASVKIIKSSVKKTASIKDGKLKIDADINIKFRITENSDNLSEKRISELLCRNIQDYCVSAFSSSVWSDGCDLFDIAKLIRCDCPAS